ncbi:MAG: GtrA family protein [Chitinophagales bacterium]
MTFLDQLLQHDLLMKMLKFGVVGFSSFVMDFSITYVTKEKLRFNKYIANSCGFFFSAIYNFTLNRLWTFHSQDDQIVLQMVKFGISMSIGLLLANTLIYVFNEKMKQNFYVSKLMAVCVVMIWNFTMNNLIIFSH